MMYINSNYNNKLEIVSKSSNPEIFIFQENNYYMLEFIFSKIKPNNVRITNEIKQASRQNLFQFTKYFRLCYLLKKEKGILHPPNGFIQKHLFELFTHHVNESDERLKNNPEILFNFIYPKIIGQIFEDSSFFTLKHYYLWYFTFLKDKNQLFIKNNFFVNAFLGEKKLEDELLKIIQSTGSCTLLLFYLEICDPIKFLSYNEIHTIYDDNQQNKPDYVIFNQILYTIELSFKNFKQDKEKYKWIQKVGSTITLIYMNCLQNTRYFILNIFNCWVFNLINKGEIKEKKDKDFFVKVMFNIMEKTYFKDINDNILMFPSCLPTKSFNGEMVKFFVFMSDKTNNLNINHVIKRNLINPNPNCSFLCLRLIIHFLENGIVIEKIHENISNLSNVLLKYEKLTKWIFLSMAFYLIKGSKTPVNDILSLLNKIKNSDYFEDLVIYISFIFRNTLHAKKYAQNVLSKITNTNILVILVLLYGVNIKLSCPSSFSHQLKLFAWQRACEKTTNNFQISQNCMVNQKKMDFDLEKFYLALLKQN